MQRTAKADKARELFRVSAPLKVAVLNVMLENFDEADRKGATVRYYNGSMIVEAPADTLDAVPLQ